MLSQLLPVLLGMHFKRTQVLHLSCKDQCFANAAYSIPPHRCTHIPDTPPLRAEAQQQYILLRGCLEQLWKETF
jgi:hypothetical protein